MGLIDFIKNRQGQRPTEQQQSQQQKPENDKAISPQEPAKEIVSAKQFENLGPEQRTKIAEAQALYRQGTQEPSQASSAPAPALAESNESPEAARQKMTGQDKEAPALSPTSGAAGKTANEKDAPGPSEDAAAKSKQQTQEKARQTIARRPPSWER
jgi:hypothetical protein